MKNKKKIAMKISALKDKFSPLRGKGNAKIETQTYNHPRRDKAVRSGKK
jgi:hypothetical protein